MKRLALARSLALGKHAPNVSDEVTLRITTEAVVRKPEAAR
ncbi:hypothetical protein BH23PSE2_BH23PSE2_07220 [soil metagenome]